MAYYSISCVGAGTLYLFLYPIKSARTLRYAGYAPVYNVREHTKYVSPMSKMSIFARIRACAKIFDNNFGALRLNARANARFAIQQK